LQAGLSIILPFLTLVEWGRIITISSSLLTIVFLYLLVKKYTNERVGLLTAFFFAFIPFNIYYDRAILPDPSMVMTILGATYFFDKWIEKSIKQQYRMQKNDYYLLLSLIFTATAFLLRPYALFFTLPMIYLAIWRFKFTLFTQWKLYIFLIISVIPLIAWRLWITKYPEGIPASSWLFNGNGIRFRPSFFYWIVYKRLTQLISGYVGLIPIVLGFFVNFKSEKIFKFFKGQSGLFFSFALSSIIYVCVIATGNVQHDYYQILIMPTVCMFFALGCEALLNNKFLAKNITITLTILLCSFSLYFGWMQVEHYFDIDNPSIIVAGEAVARLTPKNALVIAPYGGDTTFLNQTDRKGWAEFEKPIPQMISELGADYIIVPNPTPLDFSGYGKYYKLVASTKQFALFDLHTQP